MTASSVIHKAVRNIFWMFAHTWGTALFALVSFPIMARLLGPEPYGVLALADLVFGLTGIFVGAALTECLQQRETITDEQLDTTFWLNTGLTSLFAAGIALLAEPIGARMGTPKVADVLPALGLIMVIGSLDAVPGALLQRQLENQKLVWIDGASTFLATALALILALLGYGVWALVASTGLATVISVAGTVYAAKWRPGFRFSLQAFRDLYTFNRDTVLTYLLGYVDDAIPRFLLGLVGGERAVGLLSMAGNVAGMLTDLLMGPFNEIAMNVVARLQTSRQMVKDLLDRVFNLTTAAIYPASLGLAAISPWLIPLLVGEEWTAAILPLQIFLVLGIRDATGTFNIAILRGVGDSRSPILILLIGVVLLCCLAPVFMPYGVSGIAALIALRIFMTWPLSAWLVQRAAGYPALRQMMIGWRALLGSLGMLGAVLIVAGRLPQDLPDAAIIAVLVVTGIITYAGLMWFAGARQVQEIRDAFGWFRTHHDDEAEPVWPQTEMGTGL